MRTLTPKVLTHRAVLKTAILMLPIGVVLFTGCASTRPAAKTSASVTQPAPSHTIVGVASYYGKKYHGRKTANGEIFDMTKLTAAHRSLPFGINVRVTNLSNNQSVIVRINDRGPFIAGRIIDLSLAAAQRLGMITAGLAKVRVELVDSGKAETTRTLSDAGAFNGARFLAGEPRRAAEDHAGSVTPQVFSPAEALAGQDAAGVDDGTARW